MCGICGIAFLDYNADSEQCIVSMCESLKHRGPDAWNYYTSPGIALGHTRLSIIDLAGGSQPLCNEDETVYLTYNGEIFNYRSLREQLIEKGHQFKTNSDTEVIVHLYEQYGFDCVQYLNGQFAFAVWDSKDKTLFLARDRVGIKPLYYHATPEKIIFASEIKAILQNQNIDRKICRQALQHYFSYLYIPSPMSIYSKIKKLPPAHYLVWRNGQYSMKRYWTLEQKVTQIEEAQAKEILEQELERAVNDRLLSEVPLGAFLSGGIDSSTVAWFAQKKAAPVRTFSIAFPNAPQDESRYAELVARQIGSQHQTMNLNPGDFQQEILQLLAHFDEPFGDTSSIPTYFLCKMARREVTVCLSGDGGDELLAGYRRYLALSHIDQLPSPWRKIYRPFHHMLPSTRWLEKKYLQHCSAQEKYHRKMSAFSPSIKQWLLADEFRQKDDSTNYITDYFSPDYCPKSTMLYTDFHTYLPEFVLVKVDRMSMMNSLEVRVPFLDHQLLEKMFALPLALKLDAKNGKILLKNLMKKRLPDEILYRKKAGFGLPLRYWFKNGFRKFALEIISGRESVKKGYLRPESIDFLCSKKSEHKKYQSLLWAVMILEIWQQKQSYP